MATKHQLTAQKREVLGKKVKQLRRDGLVIASVSTPNGSSLSLQLPWKMMNDMINKAGESSLIYLKLEEEKKERPVLIEEVQLDPLSEEIVHVMFKQVNLKEKITAEIPVVHVGEMDISSAVLVTVRDAVEVEALPTDLPEEFEIDLSALQEIGDSITLADLKFDTDKVALVLGEDQAPETTPLVLVQEVKEEVEEEETPEVEGDVEVAEGEAAATAEGESNAGDEEVAKE